MAKAWLIRPFPHDTDRLSNFKSDNIIAIGWPEVSSLVGKDKNEIREILRNHPKKYSPSQLGAALATVNIFVNEISKKDFIVVPYEDDIYFAKVTSNYFFEPTKITDGYPHQRKIEWLKGPISRDQLPNDLRNSLRAPRTAADLSHHTNIIESIINYDSSELLQATPDYMDIYYPLRTDLNCTIKIPKDITKEEAERLGEFVKTLYFN
jgi:predicted Mrr-cat superfamily restriction endonuclease